MTIDIKKGQKETQKDHKLLKNNPKETHNDKIQTKPPQNHHKQTKTNKEKPTDS